MQTEGEEEASLNPPPEFRRRTNTCPDVSSANTCLEAAPAPGSGEGVNKVRPRTSQSYDREIRTRPGPQAAAFNRQTSLEDFKTLIEYRRQDAVSRSCHTGLQRFSTIEEDSRETEAALTTAPTPGLGGTLV